MNITRKNIVDWVESRADRIAKHIELKGDQAMHYAVGEMIEQCLSDLGPEWVSVDDELPKYGEPVILKINGVAQHVTYMRDRYDEGPDWFEPYHYDDTDSVVDIDGKAKLEWMSLPK